MLAMGVPCCHSFISLIPRPSQLYIERHGDEAKFNLVMLILFSFSGAGQLYLWPAIRDAVILLGC